eukprot:SAG31_NODE_5032_length_2791_cov_3.502972_3_plen_167_part_00
MLRSATVLRSCSDAFGPSLLCVCFRNSKPTLQKVLSATRTLTVGGIILPSDDHKETAGPPPALDAGGVGSLAAQLGGSEHTTQPSAKKVGTASEGNKCSDTDWKCESWASAGECDKDPVRFQGRETSATVRNKFAHRQCSAGRSLCWQSVLLAAVCALLQGLLRQI